MRVCVLLIIREYSGVLLARESDSGEYVVVRKLILAQNRDVLEDAFRLVEDVQFNLLLSYQTLNIANSTITVSSHVRL